tara:strand:- start:18838 stop:19338 length:501 start_codon:yes stop_codon:yes gene_type:complete
MKILTPDNHSYNLNKVPELVDDLQYCVLDTTNPKNIDFFFIPLIFLESFNAPSMVLEIKGVNIQMPIDWSIMVIERELGQCEMVPLTSLNDRGFEALTMNPLTTGLINSAEIKVVNVFQEVKWYFPKLKFGHIIAVPLGEGENPDCLYFAKDINQLPDTMDVGSFF